MEFHAVICPIMQNKMRGDGMYGGDCHPRACTRQNSINRVKKNGNLDNIVIIDLDGDSDVIILDIPESVQEKLLGPCAHRKGSKVPHHKIIRIDDDGDEEDEDNDVHHIRISKTSNKNLRSDRASTKPSSSVEGLANPAGHSTVEEEKFTSKVSNSEKPSSKHPSKNRYGLIDSESSLSDSESDSSDFELLEGSSGKLREQWEKASLRRKHEFFNDRFARGNQESTSGLHAGAHTSVPVDNRDDLYKGEHVGSSHTFNDQSGGENLASTSGFHDRANADVRRGNKEAFFNGETAYSWSTYEKARSSDNCNVQIDKEPRKGKGATQVNCSSSDKASNAANLTEEVGCVNPYPWYTMDRRDKWSSYIPACSKAEQQNVLKDLSSDIPQAVSINDEGSACSESQDSVSPDILDERVVEVNNAVSAEQVYCHGNFNKLHEGDLGLNQEAFGTALDISRDSGTTDNGNVPGVCVKDDALESASCGPSEEEKEDGCLRKSFSKDNLTFVKSAPNIHSDQAEQPNADYGDCMPILQDSIINGREKMKETDEYRQAQEEEWASRQRQLQRQVSFLSQSSHSMLWKPIPLNNQVQII